MADLAVGSDAAVGGSPPALTFQDGHVDLRQGLVLGVVEALVGLLTAVNTAALQGHLLGAADLLLLHGPVEGRKQRAMGSYGGAEALCRARAAVGPAAKCPSPGIPSPGSAVLGRCLCGFRLQTPVRAGSGLAAHGGGQQQAGKQQDTRHPEPLHGSAL